MKKPREDLQSIFLEGNNNVFDFDSAFQPFQTMHYGHLKCMCWCNLLSMSVIELSCSATQGSIQVSGTCMFAHK